MTRRRYFRWPELVSLNKKTIRPPVSLDISPRQAHQGRLRLFVSRHDHESPSPGRVIDGSQDYAMRDFPEPCKCRNEFGSGVWHQDKGTRNNGRGRAYLVRSMGRPRTYKFLRISGGLCWEETLDAGMAVTSLEKYFRVQLSSPTPSAYMHVGFMQAGFTQALNG